MNPDPQAGLTFLCSVAYDDLSASLAGLLHRQRCAEALLMFPQALAFFESILLHDLMRHRTSVGEDLEMKTCRLKMGDLFACCCSILPSQICMFEPSQNSHKASADCNKYPSDKNQLIYIDLN